MKAPRVALPIGIFAAAAVLASPAAPTSAADGVLELAIVGTRIENDAMGLPAALEGVVVFRSGPESGRLAGTYRETVAPQLHPELGLVGARGRAVFAFLSADGGKDGPDELVTVQRSTVVGEVAATGALLVESAGTVAEGRGRFAGAIGSMTTKSVVELAPVFGMLTELTVRFVPAASRRDAGGACPACGFAAPAAAPAGGLRLALDAMGRALLYYPPEFKAAVFRRVAAPEAEPASLAAELGLSEAVLARWQAQARQLSGMRSLIGKLLPAPKRKDGVEEAAGVVLRPAAFSEEGLEAALVKAGIALPELQQARAALGDAIESAAPPSAAESRPALSRLREAIDAILRASRPPPKPAGS
jgi:transposase-like protein